VEFPGCFAGNVLLIIYSIRCNCRNFRGKFYVLLLKMFFFFVIIKLFYVTKWSSLATTPCEVYVSKVGWFSLDLIGAGSKTSSFSGHGVHIFLEANRAYVPGWM